MHEFRGPSNSLRSLQHEDAWRGCHSTGKHAACSGTAFAEIIEITR